MSGGGLCRAYSQSTKVKLSANGLMLFSVVFPEDGKRQLFQVSSTFRLPSSLSDSLLEIKVMGKKMECIIRLTKIMAFSGVEHCLKCLGKLCLDILERAQLMATAAVLYNEVNFQYILLVIEELCIF